MATRIISWNVNGLRALERKVGLRAYLEACGAEIVGLQEVRACAEQLGVYASPPGWYVHICCAARKGYSGVALYSRRPPDRVETSLGEPRFDDEGRVQLARFGRLMLANVYFPNGSGRDRDNSRVPFKLDFYRALFERLDRLRRGGYRVLVMGDFNTAHRDIDLARPKQNRETSGFLPEERRELDRWLTGGYRDTFRAFESGEGHYTWWSQRFGVREKNIGWRIDYVLASRGAARFLRGAAIHDQQRGSDHCPIDVELDDGVFG